MVDMRDWIPLRQTSTQIKKEQDRIRDIQDESKLADLGVKDLKKSRRELVKVINPLNTHRVTNLLDPWVNKPPFKRKSKIKLP